VTTPIVMFDYLKEYRSIEVDVLEAIRRVLESGQLVLGPEVEAFEKSFASYLGQGGGAVGVNSGTDAIAIALRALDIRVGDEVITVANTAVPTVSAIRQVGAIPVFCDVEGDTALIDLGRIEACITPRTRAIVPVHLFGNVVDVPAIMDLIGRRSIGVVEDCAQAHGGKLSGRPAGTMGHAAAFSFYPTKNLGAFGDAGICCSRDPELVAKMRSIRMYGFEDRYYAEREGVNSRLDPLQAAVLGIKLTRLPQYLRLRQEIAARYDRLLSPKISRIGPRFGIEHARHLYVVRLPHRDTVRARLQERGIQTGIHYPFPVHLMRAYAFLGYQPGSLPVTEQLATEILSLPLYPEIEEEQIARVCTELNALVES
jgi:dTDP-3-amino-2,3,6-trideoxy-4-keto-D-glucose/dTDP-3-amino-3,4,6-trideoxy-alpha-D-glucose/dTDP-2,6-dideoxy-D-kanosamine transaminase